MTVSKQELFRYKGYEIPVDLVNLTGAGPGSFDAISQSHVAALAQEVGIKPDYSVIEIGCGIGRDAIPLTEILSPSGSYLGIDIIRRSIDWCREAITPRHPNFRFCHFDVKDQLHNPQGRHCMSKYRLPVKRRTIDRIFLWSVFTHLFEDDIAHYLREFARVLKPSGIVMASCFLVDDATIASAQRTNLTPFALRFEHSRGPGCYINDPKHPTGAVAYTEAALTRMIASAGLALATPPVLGGWSGLHPWKYGQDLLVLTTRAPPPRRWFAVPSWLGFGSRTKPGGGR